MTMTITIVENPNGTYTSTPDCQERLCRELYRNSRCKDGEFQDSGVSRARYVAPDSMPAFFEFCL